jgi:UDP-N-acetyl-D-mannosaminuronate dehydrogenase
MDKVCVQGLGFVGAAMAAAVSGARDSHGHPWFEVVGIDLPVSSGQARIDSLNAGRFPFETLDISLNQTVKRGRDLGNLRASADPSEFETCDIVVVDVGLDVDFATDPATAKFNDFLAAIRTLGSRIRPGRLVIIETTVPPGTVSKSVVPELRRGLEARGIDPELFGQAFRKDLIIWGQGRSHKSFDQC